MRSAVAAAAVAFLVASAASAADLPEGKWWKRPRVAAQIGLTADQMRQIEQIFVRSRTRLIDLRASLEKKQLALSEAMENRNAERRVVERQIEEVENARAELQKTRALMILDMKQVLRPEQWDRLLEIQQEFRDRVRMRRQGIDPSDGRARPSRQR